MRYIVIINSRANPKTREALDDAIRNVSLVDPDLRNRLEFKYTEYPGHAADIATEAAASYGDKVTIVACGGDGTIHEIANALAFGKTPMIAIPFGTGNDFVKTTLPNWKLWDFERLIMNLDKTEIKPVDLVKIDSYDMMGNHINHWSRYFNNVASIGLDTKVQARAKAIVAAKDTKFNRKTAYIRAALALVLGGKRGNDFSFELELEDGTVYKSSKTRYTLLSMCNGKYYGDGFCPAPMADISDGLIDVCVVDDVPLYRAIPLLAAYKTGKHVGKNGITMLRATSGSVTSHDPSFQLMGNYDGEDFFGNRIRFEVYPKAINMAFFPEEGYKR
ncbi:MAG: hypothetical protein J5685_12675 [Clostridiales bacterium]|nr:hypothetical protein [Clostridiales bacterium]